MAKTIEDIANEVLLEADLTSKDLPDLDLYIDQITTLFDRTFENHKRTEEDKIITKAMVNNYCKKGVVEPISGKKYSKDRIIEMLLVYNLKNTLMIDEIQRLLAPVYKLKEQGEFDICQFYDELIELKSSQKQSIIDSMEQIIAANSQLNLENEETRLRTILILASLSDAYRVAAQKIIDEYYPNDKKK